MADKRRLKVNSKGWFAHWMTFATGTKDIRTGITYPDIYGCTSREVWVGPFPTPEKAFESVRA